DGKQHTHRSENLFILPTIFRPAITTTRRQALAQSVYLMYPNSSVDFSTTITRELFHAQYDRASFNSSRSTGGYGRSLAHGRTGNAIEIPVVQRGPLGAATRATAAPLIALV